MHTHHLTFLLLLSLPVTGSALAAQRVPVATPVESAVSHARTPAPGSKERMAITNALRVVVKNMSGLDVVFVVRHLKVHDNWAWVEADPRSADGTQHYEPMNGLLNLKKGRWVYLEGRPEWAICEEDPDCVDPARYFKKLEAKYPGLAPGIFPRD